MATFYLVRHGEADYSEMLEKGFYGFGRSFAPLSPEVVRQAEATAKNERCVLLKEYSKVYNK